MKQCPVCNETFDDQKAFCDMDGAQLVDQTDSLRAALSQANPASSASSAWVTGTIGGLIGIIICVLLYILFVAPGQQKALEDERHANETKETTTVKPSQVALVPTNSQLRAPSPTPEQTESPLEAASPSPAAPAPAATAPPAALNDGPIATGSKQPSNEHAIIKMKDGSTVEADAAWEDAQGVWFRRSGLVSFVEKDRVEAITEPQRKPAATESKTP